MHIVDGEMVLYRLELVGGPYDGAPGFKWRDDGEHPPPERIYVGRCPGRGLCGDVTCGRGEQHPAYWIELEDVPVRTIAYEKQAESVIRREHDEGFRLDGEATYAMGGLNLLGTMDFAELVPAGVTARFGTVERVLTDFRAVVRIN